MPGTCNTGTSVAGDGGGGGGDPSPPQPRLMEEEDNRPMNSDELLNLSLNINRLPAFHLGTVVQIIRTRQPTLGGDPDEFLIDFYELEPATLRALERFVNPFFNNE